MQPRQRAKRLGANQRGVPAKNQHIPAPAGQPPGRRPNRVAGPPPFFLNKKRKALAGRQPRLNRVSPAPQHHPHGAAHRRHRIQNMFHQRLARGRMQHFRKGGLHPRAFPRGQNQNAQHTISFTVKKAKNSPPQSMIGESHYVLPKKSCDWPSFVFQAVEILAYFRDLRSSRPPHPPPGGPG
jgi:hypothetical protein